MQIEIVETEPLGRGQYGTVWKAKDPELGTALAVKFFENAAVIDRNEVVTHARALAQINHPNVVRIYGVFDLLKPGDETPDDTQPALVMDFVDGISFADWLTQSKATTEELFEPLFGLLDGLEAFHENRLAHGDLHARNILVASGQCMILDPLAHDPATAMSSELVRDKRERDIAQARHLITQSLIRNDGRTTAIGNINLIDSVQHTIDELRETLRLAREDPSRSTHAHESSDFYSRFRNAQATNNLVLWQESRKSTVRALAASLRTWREDHQEFPDDWDQIHLIYYDAIDRIPGYVANLLAAAEIDAPQYHGEADLLRQLLVIDWEKSGKNLHVRLPETLVYLLANFAGAAACANGNFEFASRIARVKVPVSRSGHLEEYWRSPNLVGWPDGLGRKCSEAFRPVARAFASVPILGRIFATEEQYRSALAGWRFFLTAIELAATSPDELSDEASESVAPNAGYHLKAPPMFFSLDDSEMVAGIAAVTGNPNALPRICSGTSTTESEFRDRWRSWATIVAAYWSQISDWGFAINIDLRDLRWQ